MVNPNQQEGGQQSLQHPNAAFQGSAVQLAANLEDLAEANSVDRTYVARILRLTLLAPEIVERILVGDEPVGISLAKLRNDLPAVWAEQVWGE